MDKIIVAGVSGHAKVILDILEKEGRYEIVGLTDAVYSAGASVLGYPVLGGDEDIPRLADSHGIVGGLVGIGDNWLRRRVTEKIKGIFPEFMFVTATHPSAQIGNDVSIGEGTVVMAGVVVNPSCSIGRFCILNTSASLDHDSVMGDFSSLAPNAVTGGNTRIGESSAIGIGATVVHGVAIGDQTVIGAGATVLNDIDSFKVAYGTPAKVVRERKEGDKYL